MNKLCDAMNEHNNFAKFFFITATMAGYSVTFCQFDPAIVPARPEQINSQAKLSPAKLPSEHIQKIANDNNFEEQEDGDDNEKALPNHAYLGNFLKPWEYIKGERSIEITFDNAQLINLIRYFEKEYGLTFILDNTLDPMDPNGKSPVGIHFSFKTERPLNKKQAWEVFIALLDMAGLMVIPGPAERIYQITNNRPDSRFATAKEPVPTFIGVDTSFLPTSDVKIRYIYFIQNANSDVIKSVVEKLRSPISSPPILVGELNALILTDRASNIRAILAILKELDKSVLPETLTVLRLQKTDATKVKELYDNLVSEEKTLLARLTPGGRKNAAAYFTENVRVIADKRTNTLIILGPRNNVKKIEEFIQKEIDREIDLPYSPLHIYPLKFIDAETTAQIVTELKNSFQPESAAAQVGGLIGGTKFLKPTVTITAEKSTNSLIINADYEDYLQVYELLEKIDVEQPQVATRILVLNVGLTNDKEFGIQFRNRIPTLTGVLSKDVNFQTSGLFTGVPGNVSNASRVVQRFTDPLNQNIPVSGAARLLGDLINLAGANVAGSTLLTLGDDIDGVWGLLKILEQQTAVSVVAKPFLVTTNKYNAQIQVVETRRIATSNVVGGANVQQPTLGDMDAGLTVNLTPQISPDGLITLQVSVESSQFTTASTSAIQPDGQINTANGNRNVKKINTSVIIADNQVLALGGLVVDRTGETEFKVPILGDIPVFGWFFKNKSKTTSKTSLLILISSQVLQPRAQKNMDSVTRSHMNNAQSLLCQMQGDEQLRDPVHRWFFKDQDPYLSCQMENFVEPISGHAKAKMQRLSRRGRYAKKATDAQDQITPIALQPNLNGQVVDIQETNKNIQTQVVNRADTVGSASIIGQTQPLANFFPERPQNQFSYGNTSRISRGRSRSLHEFANKNNSATKRPENASGVAPV